MGFVKTSCLYGLQFSLDECSNYYYSRQNASLILLLKSPSERVKQGLVLDAENLGRQFGDEIDFCGRAVLKVDLADGYFLDLFRDIMFVGDRHLTEVSEMFLAQLCKNLSTQKHDPARCSRDNYFDFIYEKTKESVKPKMDPAADFRYCPQCGGCFADMRSLQNHLEDGECPIPCVTCGKTNFSLLDWLECVEKKHTFRCVPCKAPFTVFACFQEHIQRGQCRSGRPRMITGPAHNNNFEDNSQAVGIRMGTFSFPQSFQSLLLGLNALQQSGRNKNQRRAIDSYRPPRQ